MHKRVRKKLDSARRQRLLAAIATLAVVLAGGAAASPAARWAKGLDVFRVSSVELEGARYLSLEDAASAASVPLEASVWDDPSAWLARLEAHPLVERAEVRRRMPSTLVFVVEEREPVALVPTPTLEVVDAGGRILPIDPAEHGFDLPLLRVGARADEEEAARAALAAEAERLAMVDPEFAGKISELAMDEQGGLLARWGTPAVTFRLPERVSARRLREGVIVLADAAAESGAAPLAVDLRFDQQVVVRRAR